MASFLHSSLLPFLPSLLSSFSFPFLLPLPPHSFRLPGRLCLRAPPAPFCCRVTIPQPQPFQRQTALRRPSDGRPTAVTGDDRRRPWRTRGGERASEGVRPLFGGDLDAAAFTGDNRCAALSGREGAARASRWAHNGRVRATSLVYVGSKVPEGLS